MLEGSEFWASRFNRLLRGEELDFPCWVENATSGVLGASIPKQAIWALCNWDKSEPKACITT